MDLLEKVKDKVPADKLEGLKEWYAWCDNAAERYSKELRSKLALELGFIPPELVAGMKASFVAALREAGRHIVTTKLVETVKAEADPPPAARSFVTRGRSMTGRGHGYEQDTGPGPDSPYTPDGVFGDGGESK